MSLGPGRQHGPSSVGGIGMRDHVEPGGCVPSLTKVVWLAFSFRVLPSEPGFSVPNNPSND